VVVRVGVAVASDVMAPWLVSPNQPRRMRSMPLYRASRTSL
jgi:hypothetical protein